MKASSFTQTQDFFILCRTNLIPVISILFIKMSFSLFPVKLTLQSSEQNMSICNSIQHGEREADCGGHEEARMTTGTVIRGEQNCTSAVEERKN